MFDCKKDSIKTEINRMAVMMLPSKLFCFKSMSSFCIFPYILLVACLYIYSIPLYANYIEPLTNTTIMTSPCQSAVEFTDYSLLRSKTLPQKRYPGYSTKLHLIVRFLFWSFRECRVPLHCHYSQVHSDSEW